MSTYRNRTYVFSIRGQRWYGRRKQRRRNQTANIEPPFKNTPADQLTLQQVTDHDNLLGTFDRMRHENGKAPGPDGLTYNDFSRSEMAAELRTVARRIQEGTYRPDRPRRQSIPKSSGGSRMLTLRNLDDRIPSKAVADALTTALDEIFLPGVMGFRPKRGVWMLLAEMEATMINTDRLVIAQCDIRNAFNHVRIDDVMEDYRRHVRDNDLLRLIEVILRGHEGSNRTVGIDQGDPLSPLSLNLRVHYCLDRPFDAAPDHPPWYRYADNLVYPCQDVPEGHQAIQSTSQLLLPAGLSLKEKETNVVDLRSSNQTTVLGFAVSRTVDTGCMGTDALRFGLTSASWESLDESLMLAHQAKDPPQTALEAVRGWTQAWGPAFESVRECRVLERVRRKVARVGFREMDMESALLGPLRDTRDRWRKLRDRGRRGHQQGITST